jgi:hypothetical protein
MGAGLLDASLSEIHMVGKSVDKMTVA